MIRIYSIMRNKHFSTRNVLELSLIISAFFNFQAQAQESTPERCAGYGGLESHWTTNWENGLGGWNAGTRDVANSTTFDTPDWTTTGNLPGGKSGQAAFVPNLDTGDCDADDETGALSLDSPMIQLPIGPEVFRLSLSHWIATEYLYDGGNLKISVNGEAFELIPAPAIEFGTYNSILVSAEQLNTNPLESQAAFSGTEGAGYTSSWGETHVNLHGIADPGDSVRLRLDFGIDGCGGETGWYVDTVEIFSCNNELAPSDCGNGEIDPGEQCDDGNRFIDDGCSNTCQIDEGWNCTAPVSPGVIRDPSFEGGTPNTYWTEFSEVWGTPICNSACGTGTGSGALEGEYWGWFGGTTVPEEGRLSQSIQIPTGHEWLTFGLEASLCSAAVDYLEVLVDGSRRWRIDGDSPLCNKIGYSVQEVDIGPFADGLTHTIEFHSKVFGMNNQRSYFFVDVVELPGKPSICTQSPSQITSLTLIKQVVNDDGGSALPSSWTLSATGPTSFSGPGPNVSSGNEFAAGLYDLAESGGPNGYANGDWQCSGGNMSDLDTVRVEDGSQVTCTIVNDDIPPKPIINVGHSGAWYYPDTAGQGVLIDVEPETQFIFLAWFTFTGADSEHPFEQLWLTAQGNFNGDTANLTLYESSGGMFDAPGIVTTTPVGSVSLSFTDCSNGLLSYSFDNRDLEGAFPISRAIPGSEAACEQVDMQSTQTVGINSGMDGAWYNLDTSGQGFLIDAYPSGDFMFVAWFTYGDETASGLRWLTAQGPISGSQATLDIYDTNGGSFDDPKKPTTQDVGSMNIDFSDCNSSTVTYSLPTESLEGEISLIRAIPGSENFCKSLE